MSTLEVKQGDTIWLTDLINKMNSYTGNNVFIVNSCTDILNNLILYTFLASIFWYCSSSCCRTFGSLAFPFRLNLFFFLNAELESSICFSGLILVLYASGTSWGYNTKLNVFKLYKLSIFKKHEQVEN